MFWKIKWIAVMAALLALTFPAMGQEAKIQKDPLSIRIDVDFPGGTINQMLDLIEKTNGITPNVVVSNEMARLKLPPIKLKSVTIPEAIQAISLLREINGYTIVAQTGGNVQTITAYPDQRRGAPVGPSMNRYSRVYEMKNLINPEYGVDDIVTAVRTAWEMISEDHTGDLKYHVETGLLIAVGTQDELSTIDNVLATLKYAKESGTQAEYEAKFKQTIDTLESQVHLLMEEVARMKQQLKEMAQEKGTP